MIYMGIDPGQKGGIAVLRVNSDSEFVSEAEAYPYSNEKLKELAYNLTLDWSDNVFCMVEKVGAMPGQGVTSMFNFGANFGYILGVLEANQVPYELVSPQKWKKHFSLTNEKSLSVKVCKKLFPNLSLLPTSRCHKESDGMAEAALIALYAKRTDNGTTIKK